MSHRLLKKNPLFRDEIRRHRASILIAAAILSLASLLALGIPLAVKRLAEEWAAGNSWTIWLLAGGVFLLLSLGLQTYGGLKSTEVSERLKTALQRQLFRRFMGQEMAFHRAQGPGELISAIYTDIQAVAGLYSRLLPSGVSGLLLLAGATVALIQLSPGLALVLAGATLLSLIVSRMLLRHIRARAAEINEHTSQIYRLINEALHQVMVIKINRLSGWAEERLRKHHGRMVELTVRLQFLQGVLSMTVQLLLASALIAGWIVLTHSAAADELGTQLSALLFGLLLVRQLGSLAGLLGTYRQAQGAMDRLDSLLDTGPPAASGKALPPELQRVRVTGLNFFYGEEAALSNVTFDLRRGEIVAITGPNGAGKTTLFNILSALEPIAPGSVFWNDMDITGFDRTALLSKVAYLPQDSLLGQASIADNIRMGKLDASDSEIEQAAERAGVGDVIRRHPDGLDTVLGSEGSRISGGESRRIALARLLIHDDADLYLLDEPTEGLDAGSELSILDTALKALEGKTVLIITHRPAVLERVQRHLRMENGRVPGGPV
ncbi:MAG: ABC transporter ATP-binding protein [Xanthomonadales bacterium]|nr:ABC transporter ATP-binding protein [Xanthomonadales bacterium]